MKIPFSIPTLTAEDERLIEIADQLGSDWASQCFDAAFTHLEFAHKLVDIDPAMAIFRAITAEEEAATALFRALHLRNYPKSNLLLPHNHLHKAAVFPFIMGVVKHASYLKVNGIKSVKLGVPKNEDPPRLKLYFVLGGHLEGVVANPEPPLNMKITEGDEKLPPDYRRALLGTIGSDGFSNIRKYFERKANQRNLMLYAGQNGLKQPAVNPTDYLIQQKLCVVTILKAALLIWPYTEIQPFVSDLIEAFLSATQKAQNQATEYDT